jgi:hypothetical protein
MMDSLTRSFLHLAAAAGFAVGGVTAASGPLQDKTRIAWVYLAHTHPQGGSALTLMEGEDFDAIVCGERVPGRWMAGSDLFRRTQGAEEQKVNLPETADSNTLVQVAIAYAGQCVAMFRSGLLYASYAVPQARSFGSNTTVLLGLRYLGEMGEIGFFTGAIEEARLYVGSLLEFYLDDLLLQCYSLPHAATGQIGLIGLLAGRNVEAFADFAAWQTGKP